MIYAPLPGEYIASAIRRGNEILGLKSLRQHDYTIKTVTENRQKYIIYPSFLIEQKITEETLQENTLYPLAKALGRSASSTNYTPTIRWKICPACVTEDIERYGAAYIHRRNLLPAITHCSIHASILYENCPSCLKSITTHTLCKLEKCRKSFPDAQQNFGSLQHMLAKFVNELLNYNEKPLISKVVEYRIVDKIIKLSYNGKYLNAYQNIIKDTNELLGLNIKNKRLEGLNLNACSILAFLAYQTSEAYLEAMKTVDRTSAYGFIMPSSSRTSRKSLIIRAR
ncbi:TniQ family protein [Pseudomonas mohnii]